MIVLIILQDYLKVNQMGMIHLEDMEFYAFHGCFEEEQIAGNRFLVNLWLDVDMQKAAETDKISDTLNYQIAYEIVRKEMAIKSHLLEHVSERILSALFQQFSNLNKAWVKVSKMSPPMGGAMRCVSVEMERIN